MIVVIGSPGGASSGAPDPETVLDPSQDEAPSERSAVAPMDAIAGSLETAGFGPVEITHDEDEPCGLKPSGHRVPR